MHQVVVDVGLARETLHGVSLTLLIEKFGNVSNKLGHLMTAILFLEEAAGTEQSVSAVWVLTKILDRFGWVLGTPYSFFKDVSFLSVLTLHNSIKNAQSIKRALLKDCKN